MAMWNWLKKWQRSNGKKKIKIKTVFGNKTEINIKHKLEK